MNLQDILEQGKQIVTSTRQKQAEEMKRANEYLNKWNADLTRMALELVPEAVRKYTTIETDQDARVIRIALPDAAIVERMIFVTTKDGHSMGEIESVYFPNFERQSSNVWAIRRYTVDTDEYEIYLGRTNESVPDITVALALAVELGDGKQEAEKRLTEIIKARADRERAKEQKTRQTLPICPLLSSSGQCFERCRRDDCAWWNSTFDICAVLSIAKSGEAPF